MDDAELLAIARAAVGGYHYATEIPYFLDDSSCEQEPMLLILRAVAEEARLRSLGDDPHG